MIQFTSTTKNASLQNPLKAFELENQPIEHRKDPLLDRWAVVLRGRMNYVKRYIESDEALVRSNVEESSKTCPFCPTVIEKRAPRFPNDLVPEGTIRVGEATCVPSLFAHQEFNAVVVLTERHFLNLNEFSQSALVDGFKAAAIYIQKVSARHPEVKHAAIIMNFLPPAGSTIVHPHIQVLASHRPFAYPSRLEDASKRYLDANGSNYWEDLINTEMDHGERYICRLGSIDWITPYAPVGLNEINAVALGRAKFKALSEKNWKEIADGIRYTLAFYHDQGIRSFNALLYSSAIDSKSDALCVGLKIVSRYGYRTRYVSDVWSLQYLLDEREIYESPEIVCATARPYFNSKTERQVAV